jgi:hypothetical protein
VRLLSEVLGALAAGALVFLIARQAGISGPRAYAAVAVVPLAVAAVLVLPLLNADRNELEERHRENAAVLPAEAQVKPGAEAGFAVNFFAWAAERIAEDETFHMEVGRVPDEVFVDEVGVRQGAILQWGMYQLAPRLAVEQSPQARDIEPGEGGSADWLVFYEYEPKRYPGPLGEVLTYAPGFAIARSELAR